MKYFPLYHPDIAKASKLLREHFVANVDLLHVLVQDLERERSEDIVAQPRLIVGGEGSGKTWLLHELHLVITEQLPGLQAVITDGYADLVHELNCTDGQRKVLLVDDLDALIRKDFLEDLKARLNAPKGPMLIGTVSTVPKPVRDYSQRHKDGFIIFHIPAISLSEAMRVLDVSKKKQVKRATAMLGVVGTHIRAIQLVGNILELSDSAKTDRQMLYDYLYPHMHQQLESLPAVSQKIVTTVACADDGASLAQIAAAVGTESFRVSPYVTLLIKHGVLRREAKSPRKALYHLSDPRLQFIINP